MLQNRVDPFGNIISTEARGSWMGNRGVLHNSDQEIIRPFKLKAWITCKIEFKGRKRPLMAPDRYTELFFLDEATSFAAGHRPCFECRRMDFNVFKSFWLRGNPEYHFDEKTAIQNIDQVMHEERTDSNKSKKIFQESSQNIPNGSFVSFNDDAYLLLNQVLYLWSPSGYKERISLSGENTLAVLTPKSVTNAFRAGYEPQIALTAFQ